MSVDRDSVDNRNPREVPHRVGDGEPDDATTRELPETHPPDEATKEGEIPDEPPARLPNEDPEDSGP